MGRRKDRALWPCHVCLCLCLVLRTRDQTLLTPSILQQIVPKHLLWAKALFWVLGLQRGTRHISSPKQE